jgi:5-formyltetrahydrofolate cyclo-ligase
LRPSRSAHQQNPKSLMTPEVQKRKLRSIYKAQRNKMLPADVQKKSKLINENFLQKLLPKILEQNPKKTFGLYLPFGNEVESEMIADYFIKHDIIFAYPRITAMHFPLDFIVSKADQKFTNSKFFSKIIEPVKGEKIFPDVIVIPLLAFDIQLSRLGLGGGFFDRTIEFLKKQNSQIIVIGLGFEFQRSHELLPIENTDQRLDFVVTEKNVFSRS